MGQLSFLLDGYDSDAFEHRASRHLAYQRQLGLISDVAPTGNDSGRPPDWRTFPPEDPRATPQVTENDQKAVTAVAEAIWDRLVGRRARAVLMLKEEDSHDFADAVFAHAARRAGEEALMTVDRQARFLAGVRSWLAARQRGGRPVTIVAPPQALGRLVASLERHRLRFRLPAGSGVLWLAQRPDLNGSGRPLVDACTTLLGTSPDRLMLLVSFSTLVSPLVARPRVESEAWTLESLPWTSLQILDDQLRPTATGRLAMLDLATMDRPAYQWLGLEAAGIAGRIRLQSPV